MDAKDFDRLARTLSAAGTRRGLLRGLTGLPLVGAVALMLADTAAAKKKKGDRDDRKGRRKKGKNKVQPCGGCLAGATCLGGDSDEACGKNGVACTSCADGRVCLGNGVCARSCPGIGPCSGGGDSCSCQTNASGGPEFVCVEFFTSQCSNCADCAAMGKVCTLSAGNCPQFQGQSCSGPC